MSRPSEKRKKASPALYLHFLHALKGVRMAIECSLIFFRWYLTTPFSRFFGQRGIFEQIKGAGCGNARERGRPSFFSSNKN